VCRASAPARRSRRRSAADSDVASRGAPAEPARGAGGIRPAFGDRLAALVEQRRSQVVLGLDPDPAALWPVAVDGLASARPRAGAAPGERAADAVERHCRAAIEAAGAACVAVKLQLACFERLGAPGWRALEAAARAAREHGLLVVADGKRGDVPVTARAYAQALVGSTPTPFGEVRGLGADAFTANPLLGADALEPLVEAAAEAGAGVFCLVRTSNPGAAAVQDLPAPTRPLHELLAGLVDELGRRSVGERGLAGVGAVIGATRPDLLGRLRALMPRAVFLLPGVGAQGGTVDALRAAFEPHPAGGLVTASRSIVDAWRARAEDPAAAARQAAEELRASAWALSTA
jgi:orotidine-5'-phosphate decarboxylase